MEVYFGHSLPPTGAKRTLDALWDQPLAAADTYLPPYRICACSWKQSTACTTGWDGGQTGSQQPEAQLASMS